MGTARFLPRLAAGAALAFTLSLTAHAATGDVIAVRAGTLHRVDGKVIEGGATVLVRDGKIVAVGATGQVEVPPGARTVDYGDHAVLVPGLVAADSRYGSTLANDRTASAGVRAVDNFDPYTILHRSLTEGVTTLYLAPARNRLVAGQGAVVKSAGELGARTLRDGGVLHGSIAAEARRTPGFWEPRLPATADVGLGIEQNQLPRTTMGALMALDEILRLAGGEVALAAEYGPQAEREFAAALKANATWRMGAESEGEVRALLAFFAERKLPLVIDGADGAKALAAEIASAGVPVIARPGYGGGADGGKGLDDVWPEDGLVAALIAAGVKVAVAAPSSAGSDDLLFAAGLAQRGGLDDAAALRTITLSAAEILGVADRVGSIGVGKDADLVVLSGAPLAAGSNPIATWVDGVEVWNARQDAAQLARYRAERAGHAAATVRMPAPTTVVSVDELHLGDGRVLAPGEVLLRDGKIAEVGARVGRPAGTVVVSGAAAMPGMIDSLGFLGLEGSQRPFSSRSDNTRILTPGDRVDRSVARRGVTTVHLASRSVSGATTPTVAYKPAATTFEGLIVDPSAAVRMKWNEDIVAESGEVVRQTLAKAVEYRQKWDEYETAIAKWTPPTDEDDAAADESEETEEKKDSAEAKAEDKKPKKKKGERDPARAVTGVFEGQMTAEGEEPSPLRLQLLENADGTIEGSVRTIHHSEVLPVTGRRTDYAVELTAKAPDLTYTFKLAEVYSNDPSDEKKGDEKKGKKGAKDDKDKESGDAGKQGEEKPAGDDKGGMALPPLDDEPADGEKKKDEDKEPPVLFYLRGEVLVGERVIAKVDVEQKSTEYKVAKRPNFVPAETPKVKEPKGKPKAPSIDPDLEILRRAMAGDAAVLVEVERPDQILACVDAFAAAGLKPVLVGADGAEALAAKLRGRIAGVLPSRVLTQNLSARRSVNRYAELAASGLPIAFHSAAEEGAADLATFALRAVADGLSPATALIGLTSGAAEMLGLQSRVGALAVGLDADVLLLDGSPYNLATTIQRVWINGEEVR